MTEKEFINNLANGQEHIIQKLSDLLDENEIGYCVIGGLAVNAYVEPVVSLDLRYRSWDKFNRRIASSGWKKFYY